MNILITNDDGIRAPGLAALCSAARAFGEVHVVAPHVEQSGAGHAITLVRPLRASRVACGDGLVGWSVTGTPADCVKLAVLAQLIPRPDVVLSGVNFGHNVGLHVFYSGTVAAALEGAMLGIPGVAISVDFSDAPDYPSAAEMGCAAVRPTLEAIERGEDAPGVLNVNVPALPRHQIRGVRAAPQSCHPLAEAMERRQDPRGNGYYWLGAGGMCDDVGPGTDAALVRRGYVTVTPLQFDATDRRWLGRLTPDRLGEVAAPENGS